MLCPSALARGFQLVDGQGADLHVVGLQGAGEPAFVETLRLLIRGDGDQASEDPVGSGTRRGREVGLDDASGGAIRWIETCMTSK